MTISDDGVGIGPEELERIRENLKSEEFPQEHLGIYNPHRRIRLAYGSRYGVSIESKIGEGTAVHVLIPYLPVGNSENGLLIQRTGDTHPELKSSPEF